MGTGILRYYLKENPLENLGKVVFISPPSHGSHLADVPFVDKLPVMLGGPSLLILVGTAVELLLQIDSYLAVKKMKGFINKRNR